MDGADEIFNSCAGFLLAYKWPVALLALIALRIPGALKRFSLPPLVGEFIKRLAGRPKAIGLLSVGLALLAYTLWGDSSPQRRKSAPTKGLAPATEYVEPSGERPNAKCPNCGELFAIPRSEYLKKMQCDGCGHVSDVKSAFNWWQRNSDTLRLPWVKARDPDIKAYIPIPRDHYGLGDCCARCGQAISVRRRTGNVTCPKCGWTMPASNFEPAVEEAPRRRFLRSSRSYTDQRSVVN